MADWIDDMIGDWDPNGGSGCGDGEGFVKLLFILGILFVIVWFVLPLFGIEFNPFDVDFDALFS